MYIEVKVFTEEGDLLQTLTASPQKVSLETIYENAREVDPLRQLIVPRAGRVEQLILTFEKLEANKEGVVYTLKNEPILNARGKEEKE